MRGLISDRFLRKFGGSFKKKRKKVLEKDETLLKDEIQKAGKSENNEMSEKQKEADVTVMHNDTGDAHNR